MGKVETNFLKLIILVSTFFDNIYLMVFICQEVLYISEPELKTKIALY